MHALGRSIGRRRTPGLWVWLALACLWAGLIAGPGASPAAAGEAWSLARCLEHAHEHAPEVLMRQKEIASSRLDVADAAVRFHPDVAVRVGYDLGEIGGDEAWVGELLISDILRGYRQIYDDRLAAIQAEISQLNLERTRAWLELKVGQTFLRLLAGLKKVELEERLLSLAREKEAALKILLGRGLRTPVEARQAGLAARALELDLRDLEEENRILGERLKALIGLKPGAEFRIESSGSVSEALAGLVEPERKNLDVALNELERRALAENERILKLEKYPSPMVATGWASGSRYQNDGFFLLVGFRIPLYTAGRQDRRIERQGLKLAQQAIEIERLKRNLDLRRSELESQSARTAERLALARQMVGLAEDQSRLLAEDYSLGRVQIEALLTSRVEQEQRRVEVVEADLDLSLSRWSLRALERVVVE